MLSLASRDQFHTLLDAYTLTTSAEIPAIIYLASDDSVTTVTRGQFIESAENYAIALQKLAIKRDDLVIIAHTQNLESIFAFWGALLIGAIPSMFPTITEKSDPDLYLRSLAKLVSFSEVSAVVTTDEFAQVLRSQLACPIYDSESIREQLSVDNQLSRASMEPSAVAFLQHSSGTTGLQKGVALSHEAVLNQLASYSDAIGLNANDVIVSWLPLYHDMGLIAGFLLPLVQGIPLVLMSPFDWVRRPAILFRAIDKYHGTLCWLPNFAYNHCARRIRQHDIDDLSLKTMRMFINCSEPVHHESHELFLERFAAFGIKPSMLAVSYAMAENTFAVTQTPLASVPLLDTVDRDELQRVRYAKPVSSDHPSASVQVSCGKPIQGVSVRAVNHEGIVLLERLVGELVVQSDSMLTGYYRRPDLQPIKDGWYYTGDQGYIAGGEVFVVGRSKDLIINAGKNVYPQDIEAVANTVSGIRPGRVVAFGVYDEREGTEVIVIVAEVDTDDPSIRNEITKTMRQKVAQSTTVTATYVRLVDSKWLVKTSSGKIARSANRDKWLSERT